MKSQMGPTFRKMHCFSQCYHAVTGHLVRKLQNSILSFKNDNEMWQLLHCLRTVTNVSISRNIDKLMKDSKGEIFFGTCWIWRKSAQRWDYSVTYLPAKNKSSSYYG